MLLWDRAEEPPGGRGRVLFWKSYRQSGDSISVPRYVEEHAQRLRARYLAIIHDLGEARINGKRVVEHFDVGRGVSLWWMTALAVKSPVNSPRIFDCLLLMALDEILEKERPPALTLATDDTPLAEAVAVLCRQRAIRLDRELRPYSSVRTSYIWIRARARGAGSTPGSGVRSSAAFTQWARGPTGCSSFSSAAKRPIRAPA